MRKGGKRACLPSESVELTEPGKNPDAHPRDARAACDDALGGMTAKQHGISIYYSLVQLCAWWAVWSLYDTYLLKYTPVSELAMMLACAVLYTLPYVATQASKRARGVAHAITAPLERI
jgi:hypothetical protein